jgi:hypothetical protein
MAEQENGSSPLPRRWPGSVTGGRHWWSRRCPAGRSDSNDLLGQIPGIAANILSERFKRLGREGLLMARPYSERPPRTAYQLTAEGTELARTRRLLAHGRPSTPTRLVPRLAPRRPSCERCFTGGAPGARTLNPRIKSGLLGRAGRSTCADATRGRTESTHRTGIRSALVPRVVPRHPPMGPGVRHGK